MATIIQFPKQEPARSNLEPCTLVFNLDDVTDLIIKHSPALQDLIKSGYTQVTTVAELKAGKLRVTAEVQ